ncbi:MAG: Gfo/Idh/MocA family oxidoreductase [Firmicutes bacterium]|nr:Gfo/Idh/MocA family oxidoreductase [Bacillota bacterium]
MSPIPEYNVPGPSRSPIRVALVGLGRIAVSHAAALQASGAAQLALVVDHRLQRCQHFSERYNVPYLDDFEATLSRADIDAIEICTPHVTHPAFAIAAACHGKHVLTEKPLATRIEAADAVIAAAQLHHIQVGVVYQMRFTPAAQQLKKWIEEGAIGKPLGARGVLTWHRPTHYYAGSTWKGRWATEGGGVLINQAIHLIDLMLWYLGEVTQVRAYYANVAHPEVEVEDTAQLHLRFSEGSTGIIYASTAYVADAPLFLEIIGEQGTCRLIGESALLEKKGSTTRVEGTAASTGGPSYWGSGHDALIDAFYHNVQEERPFLVDAQEGRKSLAVVLAAYDSARLNEPVSFPYSHTLTEIDPKNMPHPALVIEEEEAALRKN